VPRIIVNAYTTWDEFKLDSVAELFSDSIFKRGKYLFRGQRNSEWKLTPSFDRWFLRFSAGRDRVETARRLLTFFKKECEGLDLSISDSVWDDEAQSLALGQHYGLPTRLLDWSESPYIAAFFAFNEAVLQGETSDNVAIWALDTDDSIWTGEQGVRVVDIPYILGNIRLRNQAGKFTLSKTPFPCLEDYVNYFGEGGVALVKFTIPAVEATRAIADLDAMGISHSRVYPELVGYTSAAKMRVILTSP